MQIILSTSAKNDVNLIKAYISKENIVSAIKVIDRIFESIQFLQEFPTMGRILDFDQNRKLTVSGTPYIVIYRIKQMTIQILRVLHTARNWQDILEKEPMEV